HLRAREPVLRLQGASRLQEQVPSDLVAAIPGLPRPGVVAGRGRGAHPGGLRDRCAVAAREGEATAGRTRGGIAAGGARGELSEEGGIHVRSSGRGEARLGNGGGSARSW